MDNATLPDNLPQQWLNQIKDAVKPTTSTNLWTFLGSILASTVIATLIGSYTSYKMLKPIANADLEKARVADKRQKLQDLRSHLSLLTTELNNIPNAKELRGNPILLKYAKRSANHAADEMAVIEADLDDPRIDRTIADQTSTLLDKLASRMKPALDNISGMSDLAELYGSTVSQDIRKLQDAIDQDIRATKL